MSISEPANPPPAGCSRRTFLAGLLAGVAAAQVRGQSEGITVPQPAHAGAPRSRLILLGTGGGPTPKKTRAMTAQAIVIGDRTYVIDCGDGVGRQMALAGIPLKTIRHIFVTHLHSDHVAGYGPLLLLAWGSELFTRVDTWGPPPLSRSTQLYLEANETDLRVRERDEGRPPLPPLVHAHDIVAAGTVLKDDLVTVTAGVVDHPLLPLALGYRFDCPDRSIAFSGDTHQSDAVVALAKDADVLVHEVLYVPKAPGAPGSALRTHIMNSHTSAEEAGRVAARAGVKTLVLSHFVPGETTAVSDEEWLAAARTHFTGRIIVGRDLMEM